MSRTFGAARASSIFLGIGSGSLMAVACLGACGDTAGETGGAATTTTTTTTTSTTTTTTSGTGGSADECSSPNDCPDPGTECVLRLCFDHKCGTLNAAYGTPAVDQTDGDCKLSICDGNGAKTSVNDNDDLASDAKQCTVDVCANGTLSHDPSPAGTPCGESGGSRCDGAGACVQCNADADCQSGAVCSAGSCVAPACTDMVVNGAETDVDCGGGACAACDDGKACAANTDCKSGLCAAGKCAATTPIITAISAGHDRFFNVAFDAQGNIFTVGVSAPGTDTATDFSTMVAKFTPQGVLDTTFGTMGVFTKNITVGTNGELARAIGFQSSGKIIIGATVDHVGAADIRDRDVAILRLNTDGTLDTTFGTNGVAILDLSTGVAVGSAFSADSIWHLVVQPDDKIVFHGGSVRTGGTDTDYTLVRLLPDGTIDSAFGTNGKVTVDVANANASARSLTLLADGSILGGGYADIAGVGTPVAYKVSSSGVLDTTFGTGGIFSATVLAAQTEIYALAPQGNKFVTIGYGRANATTESLDWTSLRFLPNGTLDPTYGTNGLARVDVAGFNDQARDLVILPDNRVMFSGAGRPTANNVDGAVGVLTANGQPDTTFSPNGVKLYDLGGANDFLWGVKLSPSKDYVALAGIKGIATGAAGNDDSALVLIPIK